MDGYEVCRRIRQDARHGVPAGRDDHGERRPGEGQRASKREPTTSSPSPSTRRELLARVASLVRVKRYHDTIERQTAELAGLERRARGAGRRPGGRARAREPAAPLPRRRSSSSSSSTPATSRSSSATGARSSWSSATCAASPRSPRRASPRRSWACCSEYHAALGDLIHRFEGTLERFTGDGLMVFFNDPMPVRRRARCARSAWRWRCADRVQILLADVVAARPRPRLRHRHRAGLRDAGPHRLRGSLRLRRDRQRHEPRGATVLRRGSRGRSWSPSACYTAAEGLVVSESSGDLELRGFCRPVRGLRRPRPRRGPGRRS